VTQTKTITFHEVTFSYPTADEIRSGVYALHKLTGNLVKIGQNHYRISAQDYSLYALAASFPPASKYDEKYNDLVKAKEILKADRWDAEGVGQAIGLIKRFLDKNAKL
jgi:hypothetical protein